MLYIVIMLLSIIGAALFLRVSDSRIKCVIGAKVFTIKYQKLFAGLLMFLPLFLTSALRYGIGTDYFYTYTPIFKRIQGGGTGFNEIGFTRFTELLTRLSDDPQILFFVTSLLTVGLVCIYICRYSPRPRLSIFLYVMGGYYLFGLSGVRQALSIAIFVFSIKYIRQRKFVKYLLCILIAANVHTMAWGYILAYFIYNIDIKAKTRIIIVSCIYAIRPLLAKTVRLLISYTPYSWYIGSTYDRNENAILLQLMCIGIFVLALLAITMNSGDDKHDNLGDVRFYLNLHMVGVICSSFIGIVPVGTRVTYMTFFMAFASIPCFLNVVYKNNNRIIMEGILIAAFVVYWIYVYYIGNAEGIFPYQSIFSY